MDDEIVECLPKIYQKFYQLCEEAGIGITDDNREVKPK